MCMTYIHTHTHTRFLSDPGVTLCVIYVQTLSTHGNLTEVYTTEQNLWRIDGIDGRSIDASSLGY